MTRLLVVGLSHRTAPLEVRETLAVGPEELERSVLELRTVAAAEEAMLLATCNRVEAYVVPGEAGTAAERVRALLESRAGRPIDAYLYEHRGEEAVRHLFRVAASLDSLVVGEPQILGQVKDAYATAERVGASARELGRCVPRAFAVAKRVRSETKIAQGAVSVSSIAVDLAEKVLGDLQGRRVLLVGAGKMGEVSARKLRELGGHLTVVNRSLERAEELARACGGEASAFGDLELHLGVADVVISSTASPRFVITHEMMSRVVRQRRYRPLFLVDIAVPRDIDPRVNDLENVFLFDIDDLKKVVDENVRERQKEAAQAERIVELELDSLRQQERGLDLVPTIVGIREHFDRVGRAELERTLARLKHLSPEDRAALETMMGATLSKLLHHPIARMRQASGSPEGTELIAAIRALFPVHPEPAAPATEPEPAADTNEAVVQPAGGRRDR